MASTESVIAFQGIKGANSELACRIHHPYLETLPCDSFSDIFKAIEEGRAAHGLIPVENSYAGRVAEIHNLLPETSLQITSEYFHPVTHQLVGVKGSSLKDVKQVYSHPMALMQCRKFLAKHGLAAQPYFDTAGAARDVSQWNDPSKAAISTALAADLYGLSVLQPDIQDAEDNVTHFVTISKQPAEIDVKEKHVLTSLLFIVRNIPAGLYKALGSFATNNINILKLESYVPNRNTGVAQFFITIEGHPEEQRVQLAMEELGFFTKKVKLLGSYIADPARYK